ncbi:MAG: PH domain-containing protein [Myxococcota bacterium]
MDQFTPLATQARLMFHLQSLARWLFVWLPLVIAGTVAGLFFVDWQVAVTLGLGVLFLRFLLALWWPWLSWSRWGYRQGEEELLIRRGVLFRSITAIPIERIQHVDVRQGPIEQWFDIARVHIYTASGLGSDGVVPGLLRPVADQLRDRLIEGAGRGDDGV